MRQELIWRGVEVIEKMERETGFEPATSSLGISASIDYTGQGVHGGDTDPWSFSNLHPLVPQQPLNGVETECMSAESTAPHVGPMSGSRTGWRGKLSTGESVVKG